MDKPTLGAIILAKAKPSIGKPDADKELGEDKSTSSMTYDSAIDDLFDALKADDKEKFKKSFSYAVENCPEDSE